MSDERRWGDMYGVKGAASAPASTQKEDAQDDFDALPGVDPTLYRPFFQQHGRSRPSLFIDLRVFDERSGSLKGTMLSYPQLVAVDYVEDHTILLDFGMRHVRIEGDRLGELIARLHTGTISVIQAYSKKIWGDNAPIDGPFVRSIVHLGLGKGH